MTNDTQPKRRGMQARSSVNTHPDRAVYDDAWIADFLCRAGMGTIATARGEQPFSSTLLFAYDAETKVIYFHTARRGRVWENIAANPRVCFTAAEMGRLLPAPTAMNFSVEYQSVVVFGTARLLADPREAEHGLQLILDKYFPHLKPGRDYREIVESELSPTAVYRMEIEEWSGNIVAALLFRRFVNPLADVIYAARDVSTGRLDTRVPTTGPQDLRRLSESFNEMAASLERNDRERREMLADIAHELRTPLSVIRGRLEGIVDGIYPENGPQVSMALEQTYAMQRLVDDLRLLTLVETRQLPFDKRDVNVGDVINRGVDMFSAEAQEKNISLSFAKKNGNLTASIDPQRFEQVIGNLLGNALRYVPEGGRVWVTASETKDGVCITVNDNGPGVPDEDLPFIFDRFWRKDRSRSRISGGSGLGLAIAKQLVEAQDGTIAAMNLPGGGLQVSVEIKKQPAS